MIVIYYIVGQKTGQRFYFYQPKTIISLFFFSRLANQRYSSPFMAQTPYFLLLMERLGSLALTFFPSSLFSNYKYCKAQGDLILFGQLLVELLVSCFLRSSSVICLMLKIIITVSYMLSQKVDNIMLPNKIGRERYSSQLEIPRSLKYSPLSSFDHSPKRHPAALINFKESQIDMLKKRISALVVKEDKISHKTINNDMQMQRKVSVKVDSFKIKLLLEKQRLKDAQKLQRLRNKNLQTRMQQYYKTKSMKEQFLNQKKEQTQLLKNKSKQYTTTIHQHKEQSIQEKRQKKSQIYQQQLLGKQVRSRVLMNRIDRVKDEQRLQAEHLQSLGLLKDRQIKQLGKLQFMMVQKTNSSRIAYQVSKQKISKPFKSTQRNSHFPYHSSHSRQHHYYKLKTNQSINKNYDD